MEVELWIQECHHVPSVPPVRHINYESFLSNTVKLAFRKRHYNVLISSTVEDLPANVLILPIQ